MSIKDQRVWYVIFMLSVIMVASYCKFLVPDANYAKMSFRDILDLIWILMLALGLVYGLLEAFVKSVKIIFNKDE